MHVVPPTTIYGRFALVALFAFSHTHVDAFGSLPRQQLLLAKQQQDQRESATVALMFFADESAAKEPTEITTSSTNVANDGINVVPSSGDMLAVRQAATFMVENFWLASPRILLLAVTIRTTYK